MKRAQCLPARLFFYATYCLIIVNLYSYLKKCMTIFDHFKEITFADMILRLYPQTFYATILYLNIVQAF